VSGINIQFLEISLNHKNIVSNGGKWEAVVVNAIVILNNILMDTIYRTSVNVYD
jgi:hypothetical protein